MVGSTNELESASYDSDTQHATDTVTRIDTSGLIKCQKLA